jgi:hypothetical protein
MYKLTLKEFANPLAKILYLTALLRSSHGAIAFETVDAPDLFNQESISISKRAANQE